MNYKEKLKNITTFVFDYDGVMSEGKVWTFSKEDQVRTANVKDGYALSLAKTKGYRIAVISGGRGQSMRDRLEYLGITDVYQGAHCKMDSFEELLLAYDLKPEEIAYMGDDIPDYDVMMRCGVKSCPADAAIEIKEIVDFVSIYKGGDGCVRDLIEQVLKARGDWFKPGDVCNW